jgi:hypothetical protein
VDHGDHVAQCSLFDINLEITLDVGNDIRERVGYSIGLNFSDRVEQMVLLWMAQDPRPTIRGIRVCVLNIFFEVTLHSRLVNLENSSENGIRDAGELIESKDVACTIALGLCIF